MMRKVLISLAAAASALAVATPASAQYFPQPPQGYGYGYNNNYGQARNLQVRINQIQRQIAQLDRRNVIRNRQADRLRAEARNIERRLRSTSRYGLDPRERQDIEIRIARLEQQVRYAASYGRGYGQNGYNGYNGYGQNGQYAYDRDRDGRDDRYEDDQGSQHDDR